MSKVIGVAIPDGSDNRTIRGLAKDIRNVLEFAQEKLGTDYTFAYADTRGDPKVAKMVAESFVNRGVQYVLGLPLTGTLVTAGMVFQEHGVVTISSMASGPAATKIGRYILRARPSEDKCSQTFYPYLRDRYKRIATLSEHTAYALGVTEALIAQNLSEEVSFLSMEFAEESAPTWESVDVLLESNPDAIFLSAASAATLWGALRAIRTKDPDVQLLGSVMPGVPEFVEKANGSAKGLEYVTFKEMDEILTPAGMDLFGEFKDRFGEVKSDEHVFPTTWAALVAMHTAIENGDSPIDTLYSSTFNSVIGDYSFTADGEIDRFDYTVKIL